MSENIFPMPVDADDTNDLASASFMFGATRAIQGMSYEDLKAKHNSGLRDDRKLWSHIARGHVFGETLIKAIMARVLIEADD